MNLSRIDWPFKKLRTWNPIFGCLNACPYCYAQRWANRFREGNFEPAFNEEIFKDPELHTLRPQNIFVGSMSDVFGPWVPKSWILRVLDKANSQPQHTYIFLTKNPARYNEFNHLFPPNTWLGTTITGENLETDNRRIKELFNNTPHGVKRFISAEPLMGPILRLNDIVGLDLVIVGAMSGPKAIKPRREWLSGLKLINGKKIYLKKSMEALFEL